jgi:hypothetical protein
MRVAVIGAGVGGLATGIRLAHAGHAVTVFEAADAPGGKCGRVERDSFAWDSGPSLLTMPWVLEDLFAQTGGPLSDEGVELLRVEPVTRYSFADGTGFDLSADLPRAMAALEGWAPGAGTDWARFLGVCAGMWRASEPFLTGPPPWPPRRPAPRGADAGSPRLPQGQAVVDAAPAGSRADPRPRLRMVVDRFATYAGADPRAGRRRARPGGLRGARVRRLAPAGRALRAASVRSAGGSTGSAASCVLGTPVQRVLRTEGRAAASSSRRALACRRGRRQRRDDATRGRPRALLRASR